MTGAYDNIIIGKDKASETGLQIQKEERVELFGGLEYVSRAYFMFILRMEYVFMSMLTPEKLAMMGSSLITDVYQELSSNKNVKVLISTFGHGGCDETDDETMMDLIVHLTKTYCRMRVKDFVRKYMKHGFKNKNLGKDIRPMLAIISNPEVRKALVAAKKKTINPVSSITDPVSAGNLDDKEMHTMMDHICNILLDDDYVDIDKYNLFQEHNV